jgi:hypothetical protein
MLNFYISLHVTRYVMLNFYLSYVMLIRHYVKLWLSKFAGMVRTIFAELWLSKFYAKDPLLICNSWRVAPQVPALCITA